MQDLKGDFPIFAKNPGLVYLDSACTSLKPRQVIDAEMSYYTEYGACGGRSSHRLGRKVTEVTEQAREKVASFVGADAQGLIWTKNTTEGLNLLADSFDFSGKKKVVTSVLEHHAVLLPLMRLRDERKIELTIIQANGDGEIGKDAWVKAIDRQTALVMTNCGTNTTGRKGDVASIARLAHDNGALICVDGAQGVPHSRMDMRKANLDFLCFSGHKMLGPTGIGVFAAKKEHLKKLKPYIVGGGTVKTVSEDRADYVDDHTRFEAGIQDYAGILGLAAACDYLKKIGMENVERHEAALAQAILKELEAVGAIVYGPKTAEKSATYSFNLVNAKAHDVALMLDKDDIALRSGFFCAQPAMEALGAKDGAIRVSGYVYNSIEDIKRFGESLGKISVLYG
ncbi:MAG: cysteine desulfurase [Candidatus Micrarchaeota archaeon]